MSKGGGELIAARKKALGLLRPDGAKEKDEDLLLFRELHKREKDRGVSLLLPVSEEFEAHGQNSFYGMAPGKFLSESGKNDYDWLKTPPATPLFPSLEMESNSARELAVQKELPIIQPTTKPTGNSEAAKAGTQRSKSPTSNPKVFPRYSTPSGRLSTSLAERKSIKSAPVLNHKMNQSYYEHTAKTPKKSSLAIKPVDKKESQLNMNMLASNFNKSMGLESRTVSQPKNRGISPFIRSTIPGQRPEFSDETPPNLRTDRSCSVSRARSSMQTPTLTRRLEPIMQFSHASNSSSISRGRKQETDQNTGNLHKDKAPQGNRTQVLGSRMVDRVLNARMSNAEEKQSQSKLSTSTNESSDSRRASIEDRQSKTRLNSSMNEAGGFGRFMSKSSLDMALKHMDYKRDSSVSTKNEVSAGRRSVSVSRRTST